MCLSSGFISFTKCSFLKPTLLKQECLWKNVKISIACITLSFYLNKAAPAASFKRWGNRVENCQAAERRDISSPFHVFIGKRSRNKGGNTLVIRHSVQSSRSFRRTRVGGTCLLTALRTVLAVRQGTKDAFQAEHRWGVRMVRK